MNILASEPDMDKKLNHTKDPHINASPNAERCHGLIKRRIYPVNGAINTLIREYSIIKAPAFVAEKPK